MGFENFGDKLDVREYLTGLGLVGEGEVITPDDYTAIEARTKVLIRESQREGGALTEEEAVPLAYIDRFAPLGLSKIIDTIEPEKLRELISIVGNRECTVEESEAFIRYMQGEAAQGLAFTEIVKKWVAERAEIAGGMSKLAVADATDTVRGLGNDQEKLMREARGE